MTETCTVATSTLYDDIDFVSSGCLVPSFEAKIMADDGREIKEYDQEGELLLRSPSVVLGYLNNEKATKETFGDGWCKTGDKALVRKTPNGNEHVWIVDRIKELIKVKVSIFNRWGCVCLDVCRVFKSRLPSWRRTYYHIPPWQMWQ